VLFCLVDVFSRPEARRRADELGNLRGINQLRHTQTQTRRLAWTSCATLGDVAPLWRICMPLAPLSCHAVCDGDYLHVTCATVGSVPRGFLHSNHFNVDSKPPCGNTEENTCMQVINLMIDMDAEPQPQITEGEE
jgi:hypothetical protein